ncbi:MAG TPA: YcdB/YcdC domain-containing protein [Bacilli bacterium]|nr:YcdB/YcdC domain-containing protein [Bacilli bacterium]
MNKSNRWTAAAVVASLLITTGPMMMTASAATTQQATAMTQEQAIAAAKKFVTIPSDYKLESARMAESDQAVNGNRQVWDFSWSQDSFAEHSSLHVTLDAVTGELLTYNIWENGPSAQEEKPAKIDRAGAQKIAEDTIKKFQGAQFDQVQLLDTLYLNGSRNSDSEKEFTFRYVRDVNGIPFPQDGFSLTIDNQGVLHDYNFSWSLAAGEFPEQTDAVLSAEQANDAYLKNLPLHLQYAVEMSGNGKQQAHLFYAPQLSQTYVYGWSGGMMLDANTGEFVDQFGQKPEAAPTYDTLANEAQPAPSAGEVDKDTAIQLANGYLNLDGYKLTDTQFSNYNGDNKVWRLSYKPTDEDKDLQQKEVMINARNGELINFYSYVNGPVAQQEAKVSFATAKATAIDFVKKAVPTKLNTLALVTLEEKDALRGQKTPEGYSFAFKTLINGLPLENGDLRVQIDTATGEVSQFDSNSLQSNDDLTFADPEQAMPVESAKEAYVKRFPMQLQYVRLYQEPDSDTLYKGVSPKPGEVRLVYAPLGIEPDNGKLEATTGEWYGQWGGKLFVKKPVADIAGHWAESELQDLVNRDILALDDENMLHPNAAITRAEAVKAMVLTYQPYYYGEKTSDAARYQDVSKDDPNYEYIERAVMMGWFDKDLPNFHPNDPLTRDDLAELATKTMGYGELAEKDGVFIKPFADLTAAEDDQLGSIAIMKAFGIMKGDGTNFYPHQSVSKAELAVVIDRIAKEQAKHPGGRYY